MPARKIRDFTLSALLGASLVGASLLASGAAASAADQTRSEAVISVSGDGHASAAPDTAIVTLSVVRQAKAAQDALTENNKAMGAVLTTLKNSGIADRDLQTSGFSVQPQMNFPTGSNGQPQQPELVGYQVTNTLTVRVRDLTKLGALLDQAVGLGVNQGGDIQFTNEKPDDAINQARKLAVADAMAKAATLAQAAGVKLGRVVEISESANRPAPPIFRATMMKAAADSAVPVQSGENNFNVTVNMTYALEQ